MALEFYRRIVCTLDLGGDSVPEGWMLRICVAEFHPSTRPSSGLAAALVLGRVAASSALHG